MSLMFSVSFHYLGYLLALQCRLLYPPTSHTPTAVTWALPSLLYSVMQKTTLPKLTCPLASG